MSMSIWKELTVPADDRDHEKAKSKQPERRDKNWVPVTLLQHRQWRIMPSAGTRKAPLCSWTEPFQFKAGALHAVQVLTASGNHKKAPAGRLPCKENPFYSRKTMLAWCPNRCDSSCHNHWQTLDPVLHDQHFRRLPESWMSYHLMLIYLFSSMFLGSTFLWQMQLISLLTGAYKWENCRLWIWVLTDNSEIRRLL